MLWLCARGILRTMLGLSGRALLVTIVATRPLGAQRAPTDIGDPGSRGDAATIADSSARPARWALAGHHVAHVDKRLAAGLVLAPLLFIPIDRQAESWLQRPSLQSNPALHATASTFDWIGGTGVLAGSVAALAVGRLTRSDRLSEIGLHTTEAILASAAVVGATKGVMGRQRPFLEKGDPGDFFVGRGFGDGGLASFPSGHAAAAFSAATVLSIEARRSWPHAAPIISPVLYGGATAVGLARMYDSVHWVSDVAVGAAIGTLTGIRVMRYNDAHPDNKLSQWLAHTSLTPNGSRGLAVALSLAIR